MPLSPTERELAVLASQTGLDRFLELLVSIADGSLSVGFPITLVVDGFTITGNLAADEAFTRDLERRIGALFAELDLDDEATNVTARSVKEALVDGGWFSDIVKRQREREVGTRQALHDAFGDDFPDRLREIVERLHEDVARDFISNRWHSAFSVRDARVVAPDGSADNVPMVRVRMANVSAWWLSAPRGEDAG